jgi:DNA repair exonuclease SbcCD nuclease subunit
MPRAVVTQFKFLHAADLHLDSPLLGLSGKSADFADKVEQASRRAFDNLVELAIAEGCRLVILAGDVFDGDLRHHHTARFFVGGLRRLGDAGVRVFLIAGNHDAENRFAPHLEYAGNVHRFAHKKAESVAVEEIGVVVHGRSFGQPAVTENIAADYPRPVPNRFNIGVLHTACEGVEGPHASYAPCSLEQLVNHGYDYWALGHVHTRAVLNEHPFVVYPGNLQGRNPRETGPKGATLVQVTDGVVVSCEPYVLDEVRWASEAVDVSAATTRAEVIQLVRAALVPLGELCGDRPLALRLTLRGECTLHGALLLGQADLREELELMLTTLPVEVWLEKLVVATCGPTLSEAVDPTIAGSLQAEISRIGQTPEVDALIEACLADIKVKMPAGARSEELFKLVRAEAPARAVELALSLVGAADGAHAD